MVDSKRGQLASGIGATMAALWTLVLVAWGAIGAFQQASDIRENWESWKRILTTWQVFALASVVFAVVFIHFRRRMKREPEANRAVPPPMEPSPDKLAGKWFHSFNEAGDIKYQGKLLSREGTSYLVQLYSFESGSPTSQMVISQEELPKLRIYKDNDEMQDEYFRRNPDLFDWRRRRRRHSTDAKE